MNILDDSQAEEGIYVFGSPSPELLLLAEGDAIAVVSEDGSQVYLIKIISIAEENNIVTIVADPEPDVTDFTVFVRIDMEIDIDGAYFDMSDADEGVVWITEENDSDFDIPVPAQSNSVSLCSLHEKEGEYALLPVPSLINIGGSVGANISVGIDYHRGNFKATGRVQGAVRANVRVRYDARLFGRSFFETRITTEVELEARLSVGVTSDNASRDNDSINLGVIRFPTPIIGVTINARIAAPIRWEISAAAVATVTAKAELGFRFGTGGYQPINTRTISASLSAEGEASIKFGPRVSVEVDVLAGTVRAGLFVEAGIEAKAVATITHPSTQWSSDGTRHMCTLCIRITVDRYKACGFEYRASILGIRALTWQESITFAEWRLHLGRYFVSVRNAADSIYGGRVTFGSGDCANIEHRVASALRGDVRDADTGAPIPNVRITAFMGTRQTGSLTSDQSGSYEMQLPPGLHRVEISATGYMTFNAFIIIEPGRTQYMETFLMILGDGTGEGIATGIIRDSTNNLVLAGVELEVRSSWGNTTGGVIASTTTNSAGRYNLTLPQGHYTVTASRNGYITDSFNIIIRGTPFERHFMLSPVGADDSVYRIVLTWGANPRDLDSHLRAANGTHIAFFSRTANHVSLDVDVVTGFGPETITITNLSALGGFTYHVHDYTNLFSSTSSAMSNSGATVRVYKGAQLIRTYNVPANRSGTVWNVFSMNASGHITDINTFSFQADPDRVGLFGTHSNAAA
jgi:hypothetical protein